MRNQPPSCVNKVGKPFHGHDWRNAETSTRRVRATHTHIYTHTQKRGGGEAILCSSERCVGRQHVQLQTNRHQQKKSATAPLPLPPPPPATTTTPCGKYTIHASAYISRRAAVSPYNTLTSDANKRTPYSENCPPPGRRRATNRGRSNTRNQKQKRGPCLTCKARSSSLYTTPSTA